MNLLALPSYLPLTVGEEEYCAVCCIPGKYLNCSIVVCVPFVDSWYRMLPSLLYSVARGLVGIGSAGNV